MERKLSCGGHKGLLRKQGMRGIWASTFLLALSLGWFFFIFKFPELLRRCFLL